MGRKSKGNTNNDSKHIKGDVLEEFSDCERLRNTPVLNLKSDVLEEFSDLEQLRNTPGLNLKTPTTFAEAALMAKDRMKMRELSLVSGIHHRRPQETQTRKILDNNWESAVTESTSSPTKSYDHSIYAIHWHVHIHCIVNRGTRMTPNILPVSNSSSIG